jgi:hypothetical protein
MEDKLTKEHVTSSLDTSLHGRKSLEWINHVIKTVLALLRKRGFQEMSVYQTIVLALGMITLLVLEHVYGIRLSIILGVTGTTLLAFFTLMYLGKK